MNKKQALNEALKAQETLNRCIRVLQENMVIGEELECSRGKAEMLYSETHTYTQEVRNMNTRINDLRKKERANNLTTVTRKERVKLTSK